MSEFNCGTGCQDPKHMLQCRICGSKYHIGLVHQCATSAINKKTWNEILTTDKICELQSTYIMSPELKEEIDAWERTSNIDCAKVLNKIEKKQPSEEIKKKTAEGYKESAEEDLALVKEFEGIDEDIEENEDDMRRARRKSIRYGGKYKSRGKEKRREP